MTDLKEKSLEEFEKIQKNNLGQFFYPSANFSLIKEFKPFSSFGAFSKFWHYSKFGSCSKFGSMCIFGKDCDFAPTTHFGPNCIFEDIYHAKTTRPFITLGGCGDAARTCYFFDFVEGIYVRAGCFFGTLEEFKAKVLADEKTPEAPSKKTKSYLAFCDLVETEFK